MATRQYQVIISNSEQTADDTNLCYLHIIPIVSMCHINIGGEWTLFAAGNDAIAGTTPGTYTRTLTQSETEPVSPDVGDIWVIESKKLAWIYLDTWVPITGA